MPDEVDIRPELKALCKKLGLTYSNVRQLQVSEDNVSAMVQDKSGAIDPMTNEVAFEVKMLAVKAL